MTKFLRRNVLIFIIKVFRTIINLPVVRIEPHCRRITIQEYLKLVTIMANGIRTGDPRDFNKDVVRSSVKFPEFDKHLKKAGGHIGRNVVEITIKMKTIVWKTLKIKIAIYSCQKLSTPFIYIYIYIYICVCVCHFILGYRCVAISFLVLWFSFLLQLCVRFSKLYLCCDF